MRWPFVLRSTHEREIAAFEKLTHRLEFEITRRQHMIDAQRQECRMLYARNEALLREIAGHVNSTPPAPVIISPAVPGVPS